MKRFILTLAAILSFTSTETAASCNGVYYTMAECETALAENQATKPSFIYEGCVYNTEGDFYQWCATMTTHCVYFSNAECMRSERNRSCAVDSSTGCFFATSCNNGFYPVNDENSFVTCLSCPENATCDGENVVCNSGYTLTSTNPTSDDFVLENEKWCIPSIEENNKIDDVKQTEAFASIEGECPDGLRKSSDGCCCLK